MITLCEILRNFKAGKRTCCGQVVGVEQELLLMAEFDRIASGGTRFLFTQNLLMTYD